MKIGLFVWVSLDIYSSERPNGSYEKQSLYGSGVSYPGGVVPHPSVASQAPVLLINLATATVHVLGLYRETEPVPDDPSDRAQICYYPRGFGSFADISNAANATQQLLRRI